MAEHAEPDVVVVGLGISGLACLWRLRQAGLDALGVEASPRAGGVLRSRALGGGLVEEGPNTVLGTPGLFDLVREVGLEADLVRAEPGLARLILRCGRLHALPGGVGGVVSTRLLSLPGKLRALAELFLPGRRERTEESVEQFFARRFGREVVDAVVAPFLSGTFAGDPARLGARDVFPSLVALEERFGGVLRGWLREAAGGSPSSRAGLVSFRGGLEVLAERLVERSAGSVRLRTSVEGIEAAASRGGRLRVSIRDPTGSGVLAPRAVVLALPAWQAAPLLERAAPATAAALTEIEGPPLACVSLGWARAAVAHPLEGFGFLVARGERAGILGCLWPASIFPGRAPTGRVVTTSFVGGAGDPAGAALDDASLVERVHADLATILGAFGPPAVLSIARYERSIPQYTIGHVGRVARIRAGLAAAPGLFVTGNFLEGVSVGECVRQAAATAAAVRDSLKATVDFLPPSV